MQVCVQGSVISCNVQMARRRILKCKISDGSGSITMNFFHFNAPQKNSFEQGASVKCFGEFRRGYQGFEVTHPEYSLQNENIKTVSDETLTPYLSCNRRAKAIEFTQFSGSSA